MNLINRRQLISVPLFITGFVMILGILKAEAALLKDIRIGEYEGFTRIVFELDTPGNTPHIQPQSNGVLAISFDDTQPVLSRKIPVERSKHVKALKFWHRENRISTIFRFDFEHFRFETFPLESPPRIALDIHPLAKKPMLAVDSTKKADGPSKMNTLLPSAQQSVGRIGPDAKTDAVAEESKSGDMPPLSSEAPNARSPIVPTAESEPDLNQLPINKPEAAEPAGLPTNAVIGSSIARAQPKSNRLQFYLVISLVVITIVVLALLLLMLLGRHRWTENKAVSNVNEYLKNQDQRIASLNTRIQEQLKRYEEV